LHDPDGIKNKNIAVDKAKESTAENIISSSNKENIETLFSNENIFKIVVILISCLSKLHRTGNLNQI